jgi:NTP pyrophosphatase (non-canonical NTP hydrolase)|tara:strand:- start:5038 stop:5427 length:390 start_codon:yes stop_codon:yes gene_type:complete
MIDDYAKFVDHTTSEESKDMTALGHRLWSLEHEANLPRLLTAVIGMQSETGEFAEIVKKCVFQGKELDKATQFHLMRELGDIIWYWSQGVMSLGYQPSQIIEENIKKLEKRYPNGFEIIRSENRAEGDI